MQGAKLPEERTVDNSKVVKAVPFVQQVLSIFMPGLMFSIIFP